MKVLTLEQALQRLHRGDTLEGVLLDERSIRQVNVRDAMILARGGIVLPEQNIYYNDDDIEYDEDIDELDITGPVVKLTWEEKAAKAQAHSDSGQAGRATTVDLSTQRPEIDDWIANNKQKIEALLKPIIISLFHAENAANE